MSADTPGVIELTEQNFAASINGHPFAVVDFWAPSSAPSRAFAPTFAAAAARNPDVLFVKVNTEDQQAITTQFNIRSIPTLMIFRSNIIVYAKAGALEARALDEVLGAVRALDMEQVRRKVAKVDAVTLGAPTAPTTDVDTQAAADPSLLSIENFLRPSLRGAGSALEGRYPAAGGRRARRDTRRLRAGLCRADVSKSRQRHHLASARELRCEVLLSSSQSLPRRSVSGGRRLVLQGIRLVEFEGVGDTVVRSVLSWTDGNLRKLLPPRRPFAPSQ